MAIATALDIIEKALRQIRVLGTGDILSDEDAQNSLDTLNMMMESWSLDHLYVFEEGMLNFPFINGQATYTIGPGGQFNTPNRPLKLMSGYTRSTGIDYPLAILTDATQYDSIMNKGIAASFPGYVWYEQTYPLGTLHFYSAPTGNTVFLRFWDQLQSFPTLTTVVTLPIGYKEALVFSLALSLSGEFGIEPPATVIAKASSTIGRLKRYNTKALGMSSEAAYMSRGSNRYNIMSDSWT